MNNSTEFPIIIGTNKDNINLYDCIADYNYRNSDISIKSNQRAKSVAIISQIVYSSDEEQTFTKLYEYYNNTISEIISLGYDFIYAKDFTSLSHMRICTIICKEKNIPIILTLLIDDDEAVSRTGTSLISSMITLQSLGAYSVGFSCNLNNEIIYKILKRLFHHAEVPIILDIPCNSFSTELIECRGGAIFFINDTYKNTEDIIINSMKSTKIREKDFTDSYAASIYNEVFFLTDDITLTQKIYCSVNLSDILIDYEDEMVNALLVCISNKDDADYLIEALPFVKLPIAINCHEPETLEYTLKRFNGRAIIDSTSDMNEDLLKEISSKYGGIIY